jgi:hypothetical protein
MRHGGAADPDPRAAIQALSSVAFLVAKDRVLLGRAS